MDEEQKKSKNTSWLYWSLIIGGFILAIYLSWSCNSATNPDLSIILKGLRALIAGLFWPLYLILYVLMWAGKPCRSE